MLPSKPDHLFGEAGSLSLMIRASPERAKEARHRIAGAYSYPNYGTHRNFGKPHTRRLQDKQVQQVIGFAGDGKLRDGGVASKEFRDFLAVVPSNFLSRYANNCLTDKFDGSGLALQDVINEVGTRLGFRVEKGRYRGTPGEIGFDGLWVSPDGNAIIVEVKTTDAYRIDLETVATYRRNIIGSGRAKETNCSILIIVGRSDTGDMEAQVRGSRHAWDIRLISIDGLLRLMHLKEALDDPQIMGKTRQVLTPQEFTKVDGIIDLVFSTAEDVKKEETASEVEDVDEEGKGNQSLLPSNLRDACAARVPRKCLGNRWLSDPSRFIPRLMRIWLSSASTHANTRSPKHSGFWARVFHATPARLASAARNKPLSLSDVAHQRLFC